MDPFWQLMDLIKENNLELVKEILSQDVDLHNDIISVAFLDACRSGKENIALEFLKVVSVKARTVDGITALMLCMPHVHGQRFTMKNVVLRLLELGADISLVDDNGRNALHWAAKNANEEAVRILVRAGVNVNAHDKDGHTPLLLAAAHRHGAGTIHHLVHAGAEPLRCNIRGETALHIAVSMESSVAVAKLLSFSLDVNATDVYGNTPLHIACRKGNYKIVELLLKTSLPGKKLNMNIRRHMPTEYTPLEDACAAKHWSIVHLLLSSGAGCELDPPYGVNVTGLTDSLKGDRRRLAPVGRIALKRASVNNNSNNNATRIDCLSATGNLSDLKPTPANATSTNNNNNTTANPPLIELPMNALGLAIVAHNVEIVDLFLQAKARIDFHGIRYWTCPLTLCINNNAVNILQILLKHCRERGHSPSAIVHWINGQGLKDCPTIQSLHKGGFPLNLACRLQHMEMIRLLLTEGADPFFKIHSIDSPCEIPPFSHFFINCTTDDDVANWIELWRIAHDFPNVKRAIFDLGHMRQLVTMPLMRFTDDRNLFQLLRHIPFLDFCHSIKNSLELTEKDEIFQFFQEFFICILRCTKLSPSAIADQLNGLPPKFVRRVLSSEKVLLNILPHARLHSYPLWFLLLGGIDFSSLSRPTSTRIIDLLCMRGELEVAVLLVYIGGLRVDRLDELLHFIERSLRPTQLINEDSLLRSHLTNGSVDINRKKMETDKLLIALQKSHCAPQSLYCLCLRQVRNNLNPPVYLYNVDQWEKIYSSLSGLSRGVFRDLMVFHFHLLHSTDISYSDSVLAFLSKKRFIFT